MTRETYLDTSDDINWLLDVHCKSLPSLLASELRRLPRFAILIGNEDCPDAVDIYETANPQKGEKPILCMRQDADGVLVEV